MNAPTPAPVPAAVTLSIRTPDDILASVQVALGFVPEHSVAMLTVGGSGSFHARVDLPDSPPCIPEVVSQLLGPALQHGTRQVLFVIYTGEPRLAAGVARALEEAFASGGIDVLEILRADGTRWCPALGRRPGVPEGGVPYDVSVHPFVMQAILNGAVIHGSREERRRTIAADEPGVARVVAALAARAGTPDPVDARWVGELVTRHVAARSSPSDSEVARLLRGLLDPQVRDAGWAGLTRHNAQAYAGFWTDVVRRTPESLIAQAASVLALSCWCAGDGALAWCALDRAAESAAPCSLADLVSSLLVQAVSPAVWSEISAGVEP